MPTFGPFLIFSSVESIGDPRDGRGYVATLPTCGPFLILSPVQSIGDP